MDLTRITLYVLLPLSLVVAIVLVSQGVVQSLGAYHTISALESGARQTLPLGPAASQIAIKQLGTNGGGFFGANSAYPFENPTALSNVVEMFSILLIPASLCVSFGRAVKNRRQGAVVYVVMMLLFVGALAEITLSEARGGISLAGVAAGGNLEGKEVIHGVGSSSFWAAATTAASNGSVNAMHDSFTPLGGLLLLFLMQLGEIVFGGVGSGLYGMLAFVLLTVFYRGPHGRQNAGIPRQKSRAVRYEDGLPYRSGSAAALAAGHRAGGHAARRSKLADQQRRARVLRGAVCVYLYGKQ